MSENMALEQFRINMMQGGGGGGMETGGASGSSFMEFNGFLSELRPPSPENMQFRWGIDWLKELIIQGADIIKRLACQILPAMQL